VDINPRKLELAARFGAVPVNADETEPLAVIQELTKGRGVDVALELIGLPLTMQQAVRSLAIKGRAALVGITDKTFPVAPYQELINKEAEIIGVSDHLAQELPLLTELVGTGKLNLSNVITRSVPLTAPAINDTLDALENFSDDVRVVVEP
jgi:threonine dehydrogenase-like Zn-dependent dehydrogenase